MSTPDEVVVVHVRLPEDLVADVDRFRRRSAHEDRSSVVSTALDRFADER